jgi:hypothetical protein
MNQDRRRAVELTAELRHQGTSVLRGLAAWDLEPACPVHHDPDLVRLDWPTARLPALTTL